MNLPAVSPGSFRDPFIDIFIILAQQHAIAASTPGNPGSKFGGAKLASIGYYLDQQDQSGLDQVFGMLVECALIVWIITVVNSRRDAPAKTL
jgi:hypothetical protein